MLADVCHAFGWTLDYVLNMPASQFYLMAKQARFIRFRALVDMCDVARITQCEMKYADNLQRLYASEAMGIHASGDEPFRVPDDIATQPKPHLTGEEGRAALVGIFSAKKGAHGGR